MARLVASPRTQASARTQASSRTLIGAYRMPIELLNMGVTNYWDFRTAKLGTNSRQVVDLVGMRALQYRGNSALSAVYADAAYNADLERSLNDYFTTNSFVLNTSAVQMTWFAWVKRESTSLTQHVMTQWETTGNQRGFQFRFIASDVFEIALSSNGTAQAFYDTSSTLTDTTNWHFITATYDTTNRGQISFDKVAQTTTLVSGVNPATINSSSVPVLVGANLPSAPANFFDGKLGICGIAAGTSMTSAQITQLYNITNALGNYV